jgi:hypothetical protein
VNNSHEIFAGVVLKNANGFYTVISRTLNSIKIIPLRVYYGRFGNGYMIVDSQTVMPVIFSSSYFSGGPQEASEAAAPHRHIKFFQAKKYLLSGDGEANTGHKAASPPLPCRCLKFFWTIISHLLNGVTNKVV